MNYHLDFSIKELRTNDGTLIPLPKNAVVVVVGPNNSGKSSFLADIASIINSGPSSAKVITDVTLRRSNDRDSILGWLTENAQRRTDRSGRTSYRKNQVEIDENDVINLWGQSDSPLRHLGNFLVLHANTSERLNLVKSSPNFDYVEQSPSNPLQAMQMDEDLEKKISKEVKTAFKTGIFLERSGTGNSNIHLYFGNKPHNQLLNKKFVERLRATPQVDLQGDGVKSFVGLMLAVTSTYYPVLLIDEPEAFMHPPQAKLIGRRLNRLMRNGQLIIASHSGDVLQGILESNIKALTIVRITRDGKTNPVSILEPEMISKLWTDPLLRYSKVLDGLFHQQVVLCEADADCRWYQAVMDNIVEKEKKTSPEVLFTHCGGKHRMPSIIKALRALNVPIDVIVDIDIFQDLTHMKKLVTELGGDWSNYQANAQIVNRSINNSSTNISVQGFITKMDEILKKQSTSATIDNDVVKKIKELLKTADSWKLIKNAGTSALPGGPSSSAAKKLIKSLKEIGLHIVQEGELEGFVKEIDGHGPDWVNKALGNNHHKNLNNSARKFIRDIITNL